MDKKILFMVIALFMPFYGFCAEEWALYASEPGRDSFHLKDDKNVFVHVHYDEGDQEGSLKGLEWFTLTKDYEDGSRSLVNCDIENNKCVYKDISYFNKAGEGLNYERISKKIYNELYDLSNSFLKHLTEFKTKVGEVDKDILEKEEQLQKLENLESLELDQALFKVAPEIKKIYKEKQFEKAKLATAQEQQRKKLKYEKELEEEQRKKKEKEQLELQKKEEEFKQQRGDQLKKVHLELLSAPKPQTKDVYLKNGNKEFKIPMQFMGISPTITDLKKYDEKFKKTGIFTVDLGELFKDELFKDSTLEFFAKIVPLIYRIVQAQKDQKLAEKILEDTHKELLTYTTLLESIDWIDFERLIDYLMIDKKTITILLRGEFNSYDLVHRIKTRNNIHSVAVNFEVNKCGVVCSHVANHFLQIWSVNPEKMLRSIQLADYPYSVKFNSDGTKLMVVYYKKIEVYDATSLKLLNTRSYRNKIKDAQFNFDGSKVLSISQPILDQPMINEWDINSDEVATVQLANFNGEVNEVALNSNNTQALIIRGQLSHEFLEIWDVHSGSLLKTLSSYAKGTIKDPSFSFDEARAICSGNQTDIWEVSSGALIRTLHSALEASLSSNGTRVIAKRGYTSYIWDVESGQKLNIIKEHFYKPKFSIDDKWVIGTYPQNIYIFGNANLSVAQTGLWLTLELKKKEFKNLTIDSSELYKIYQGLPQNLQERYDNNVKIDKDILEKEEMKQMEVDRQMNDLKKVAQFTEEEEYKARNILYDQITTSEPDLQNQLKKAGLITGKLFRKGRINQLVDFGNANRNTVKVDDFVILRTVDQDSEVVYYTLEQVEEVEDEGIKLKSMNDFKSPKAIGVFKSDISERYVKELLMR